MCLRHVANEITNPWVGGADDEADRSILAASNTLGERNDQFLQGRGSEDVIKEHVFLLEQEGLIAPGLQSMGTLLRIRLTATGNDFLDLASNDKVWKQILDDLAKKGIGLTLDLVIQALQSHFSGLLG